MRRRLLVLASLLLVTAAGCREDPSPSRHHAAGPSPSFSASASSSRTAARATPRPRTAAVTKLLVFVVENHSFDQMRADMPYTFGLARRFGYADDYVGVGYPSLPNYIAITSGSTHGITDDGSPSDHPLDGPSVFGEALAAGETATVYADGMPSNCALDNGGGDYAVKHNPWAYYASERSQCRSHDVPATRLGDDAAGGNLPEAGMVVPNMCHDAHDCDLAVADGWLRDTLREVFAGPDWRSGHLAVVVTADTDDQKEDNHVLTVVAHPSQHGNVVHERLDHYSLCRLYAEVLHVRPLGNAATATSMADSFGLPLG